MFTKIRLCLVILFAATAVYAATITDDAGYPKSDANGKINVSGTYTIDKDKGEKLLYIEMICHPKAGGQGAQETIDSKGGNFNGQVSGLTSGVTYEVYTHMRYQDKESNKKDLYTPTVSVKVQ